MGKDKIHKPPIGIMPRKLWLEQRLDDMESAIIRYIDHGMIINPKWIFEYNQLINEIEKTEIVPCETKYTLADVLRSKLK